jgi:hypothetical protein
MAEAIGAAILTSLTVSAATAGATIIGSLTVAGLVGNIVIMGGLIGLSYALRPKQQKTTEPSAEQAQSILNQSVGARVRVYGRAKVGGTRAFYDSRGGVLYQIVMVAAHQISAFRETWLDDIQVAIAGTTGGNVVTGPFARGDASGSISAVYLEYRTGANDQTRSGVMRDWWPDIWSDEHQLKGIAYICTAFQSYNQEEFSKIFPSGYNTAVRATIDGALVFDPREPTHDPDAPGTWAWSDNPALIVMDYLTHADGMRLDRSRVDEASFVSFADLCDEPVDMSAGTDEKRYLCWGSIELTEEPKDVLRRMLDTCDGELYTTPDGQIAIRGGRWTGTNVTISDEHILSADFREGPEPWPPITNSNPSTLRLITATRRRN